jgi:outer membrane protein assembly factor BamB
VWGDQVFILTAIETDRISKEPPVARAAPQPETSVSGRPIRLQPFPTNYYQFMVYGIDRTTGEIRWQHMATEQVPHRGHHRDHGYASGSPTTDGRYLYVSFGSQGVYCYDLEGRLRWSRDLGRMETYADFGETITPVVCDGKVIVVHDHLGDSFVVVLDAETGETKWRAARDEQAGWSTPLVIQRGATYQLVTAGNNAVRAYDLPDGKLIWECDGLPGAIIPSPVHADGLAIFATGFPGKLMLAVPFDGEGNVSHRIAWKTERDTPYVPSPLLYDDVLYFLKTNTPVLTTVNARTGETIIPAQRLSSLRSNVYASPVGACGRVYITARNGTTVVVKHADQLEALAVNQLEDPVDASMAIVGRQILLRSQRYLYCIERDESPDR